MSLLFLCWKGKACGEPGIFRELLALSVGYERKINLDPFSVMININFPWCIIACQQTMAEFLLPSPPLSCLPCSFCNNFKISLRLLKKCGHSWTSCLLVQQVILGVLVGITGSRSVCNIWSKLISETFLLLSQNQTLGGGEASMSCDTEHLRSGRGRGRGWFQSSAEHCGQATPELAQWTGVRLFKRDRQCWLFG